MSNNINITASNDGSINFNNLTINSDNNHININSNNGSINFNEITTNNNIDSVIFPYLNSICNDLKSIRLNHELDLQENLKILHELNNHIKSLEDFHTHSSYQKLKTILSETADFIGKLVFLGDGLNTISTNILNLIIKINKIL